MDFSLTDDEKKSLLRIARESLERAFDKGTPRWPEITEAMSAPCGAFVTLKIGQDLRGCIGHMTSNEPLWRTIRELARSSAFHDPRFPPLCRNELPETRIEISVLSPLRKVSSSSEVVVGTHGVLLKRGYASGVLLPQVATEQNWDRETFLLHTCRKAGLPGDALTDPRTELFVFTATVFGE
jgi:AmmeMemoRadiSam system protein A